MMAPSQVAAPGVEPLRGEIYSLPHLAEHAARLAEDHADARAAGSLRPLLEQFRQARADLLLSHETIETAARVRHDLVPAEEWILDKDRSHLFSFDNVCEILGLDPEYMRAGLLRWKDTTLRGRRMKARSLAG